jgi:foldase protein PrsA
MILTQKSKRYLMVIAIAIQGISCSATAPADSPSQAATTALFATDTNAGANIGKIVPGAAAMVDDHIIPMDDLILECLRKDRSYVIDKMVQSYVLDRECKKRGITVSEAEIDKRIEDLLKTLAPASLEETLKMHHMSMAELRHSFRKSIETSMLVADQITSKKMIHGREILVKFKKADEPASGTDRTETEAFAIVKDLRAQLQQGKDFEALAERYSESLPADKKGDLGVLYDNMLHEEASLLTAAMMLGKGEISQPVKTTDGYCLIKAISTSSDHPPAEDSLYKDADKTSRNLQAMFLGPKNLVSLIDQSKITFVNDADLIPGKPLPASAAVIDGYPIPMKDVVSKCVAENGPATIDILVQNYLVDRECKRRGITVSDVEIDQRVDQLREQVKPHTLEEGMALHHTTLNRLRYDFQQEIERRKLAIDQVKPTHMAHARAILVKGGSPDAPEPASGIAGADTKVKKLITDIQNQLKAGKSFEELTRQYSDPSDKSKGGDFGILYEGMHEMDTTILNTALAMKKGDITSDPHPIRGGYFFLQIISTNDSHATDEDTAYATALAAYREEKAQMLVPQAIVDLLKKSKVVYYVHS